MRQRWPADAGAAGRRALAVLVAAMSLGAAPDAVAMTAPEYHWSVARAPQRRAADDQSLRALLPAPADTGPGTRRWRLLSGWRFEARGDPAAARAPAALGLQPQDGGGTLAWWLSDPPGARFAVEVVDVAAQGPGDALTLPRPAGAADAATARGWVPVLTGFLWRRAPDAAPPSSLVLGWLPGEVGPSVPATGVAVPPQRVRACGRAQGRWQPTDGSLGPRFLPPPADAPAAAPWVLQGLALRFDPLPAGAPAPALLGFALERQADGTVELRWQERPAAGQPARGYDWALAWCALR